LITSTPVVLRAALLRPEGPGQLLWRRRPRPPWHGHRARAVV